MSDPENEHPWGRHYAGKGRPRPPMMKLTSSGRIIVPPGETPPPAPGAPPAPPQKPKDGPGKPVTPPKPPEPKINWHETPEIELVTDADLERVKRETEAKRRREMIGMFKIGGYGLLGVLVLALGLEILRYVFNAQPSEERMAAMKETVAKEVLYRFTTGDQPLEVATVEAEAVDRSRGQIDYEVRVALRLREPLYGPADSNGAQPYLQMQRSLAEAQALVLQQRLFLDDSEMTAGPEMPMLLSMTHKVGERRIVRVPLTATRTMWQWRLEAHPERMRQIGAAFSGKALGRYADSRYLLFGTKEARDRIRHAMAAARKFILDVNAEHARRVRERAQ